VVNVRADGIAVVLGPLLSDARITAAALVDVDSGMVLDAWSASPGPGAGPAAPDLEMLGAQHAEVVRCALALLAAHPPPDGPEAGTCEVVLWAAAVISTCCAPCPTPTATGSRWPSWSTGRGGCWTASASGSGRSPWTR